MTSFIKYISINCTPNHLSIYLSKQKTRQSAQYLFYLFRSSMKTTMASSTSPFPYMPISQITLPDTAIIRAASAYAKKHSTEAVYNHCVRSAYWALLLAGRLTRTNQKDSEEEKPYLDAELVVLACILHDMGWSSDKESLQLSTWKRFEVDGADVARRFIQEFRGKGGDDWGRERIQRVWDAIAREFLLLFFLFSNSICTCPLCKLPCEFEGCGKRFGYTDLVWLSRPFSYVCEGCERARSISESTLPHRRRITYTFSLHFQSYQPTLNLRIQNRSEKLCIYLPLACLLLSATSY